MFCSTYSTPTVTDFKVQFSRDFPYAISAYGAVAIAVLTAGVVTSIVPQAGGWGYRNAPALQLVAVSGDIGTGAAGTTTVKNGQLSTCTVTAGGSGYLIPPTVTIIPNCGDDTNQEFVTDEDIQGAIFDASINFNPGLFPDQQTYQRAFLYLCAHQLIEKILMATSGLASQYSWLTASKSAGAIHQAFMVPEYVKNNPSLAHYSTTRYGAMYVQLIWPLLVGNVHVSPTVTNP